MKKKIYIVLVVLISLLSVSCATKTENKVLVAYFSCTGNTKAVAEIIAEKLNADLYEITPAVPYTEEDLTSYAQTTRPSREQNNPSARPEIAEQLPDLSSYTTVYLGYPIWFGKAPKIIFTFVENGKLEDKAIIPFCTSDSSPIGTTATDLHILSPNASWNEGIRFNSDVSPEKVLNWLESLND